MSTLMKLVSGHKMSSEVPQVSFYTETLWANVEIAANKFYDLLRPYQVDPPPHTSYTGVYTLHTETAKKVKQLSKSTPTLSPSVE